MTTTTPAAIALLDELERLRVIDWDLLFQRTSDWEKPVLPANGERGGGGGERPSDDVLEDRREDRRASGKHQQLRSDVRVATEALMRIRFLYAEVNRPTIKSLPAKEMQLAQVATEGWCVSCWRDDRWCEPIAKRPTGEPFYKDRCRFCGQWKAEHGQDPPLVILQKRHAGQRITQADVEKALGKAKAS